jgi:signal transduction histidine kinase
VAIKQASNDALGELRSVLDVLRQGDEAPPRSPASGLAHLDSLVSGAGATGLEVRTRVEGTPRPLSAGTDLAAYRIIQEALTNVLRHAEARTVRLGLTHEPSLLSIRIRDDGLATSADSAGGHGIDGMRERARALSGQLTAAPHPDGGFEVRAELPVPEPR